MADIEMIKLVSLRTGLGMKFVSKDAKLSVLLAQLSGLLEGKNVVLKGGTAMNRIYIKKRFSEDIDLDFVSRNSAKQKLEAINKVMAGLTGFKVERPRRMGSVYRYDCGYENEFGAKDKIRVEFNISFSRVIAASVPEKRAVSPFIFPSEAALMPAYSFEDLIARKIAAVVGREDGKDIFDLSHALDMDFSKRKLQEALKAIGFGNHVEMKKDIQRRLEGMREKAIIGNSANHYIPSELRPGWRSFTDTLILRLKDAF